MDTSGFSDLSGRRALVTGGNRGIGAAVCEALSGLGVEVVVASRDRAAGAEIAASLPGPASAVALDLADPESPARAFAEASKGGRVDILINNAGVLHSGSLLEGDHALFETSWRVMVDGPLRLVRLAAPAMAEAGWGRVVNVSSGWGSFADGLGGPHSYGVAKAALNALTVALARDLPPAVKVNSACPGWCRTRMGGGDAPRTPEQGADTIVWLAALPDDGPTGGFFRNRAPAAW